MFIFIIINEYLAIILIQVRYMKLFGHQPSGRRCVK